MQHTATRWLPQYTRPEGRSDAAAMADLLNVTGGDGFNGDVMHHIGKEFYDAAVALKHPIALEPEDIGDPSR